jgi:hypothetical protein
MPSLIIEMLLRAIGEGREKAVPSFLKKGFAVNSSSVPDSFASLSYYNYKQSWS